MKFNDIAPAADDSSKKSKVSFNNDNSLVATTDNGEQKQLEETMVKDCNGEECKDLAVKKTLDVLEQTPLATSTPCAIAEQSEENDEKIKVCFTW